MRRSSARSRCRPAQYNAELTATAAARVAELRARRDRRRRPGRRTPATGELQLGTLGSGNHFIEVTRRRAGPGLAVPALGLARRRQQDRPAPHQRRPGAVRAVVDRAAGPRPGLPGRGHRRVLGLHPRAAVGAAVRPAQPRGDDGPGGRPASATGSASDGRASRSGSTATTTSPSRSSTSARTVWVSRKGAIEAEGRPARPDPGLDGHRVVRRGAARATRLSLNSSPHGAGRKYSRSAARKTLHRTSELRAAMAGIEYRDTDAFLDEIPRGVQGHRPGDGGRRRPGRGPAHAAPDRQRQGRLSHSSSGRRIAATRIAPAVPVAAVLQELAGPSSGQDPHRGAQWQRPGQLGDVIVAAGYSRG